MALNDYLLNDYMFGIPLFQKDLAYFSSHIVFLFTPFKEIFRQHTLLADITECLLRKMPRASCAHNYPMRHIHLFSPFDR